MGLPLLKVDATWVPLGVISSFALLSLLLLYSLSEANNLTSHRRQKKLQVIASFNEDCSVKESRCKGRVMDYAIMLFHERPEFGVGVEFLSTYYVKEDKDERSIKEILTKAFKLANPLWIVKKVTVQAIPFRHVLR